MNINEPFMNINDAGTVGSLSPCFFFYLFL